MMKHISTFFLCFLLTGSLFSQSEAYPKSVSMSLGNQPALVLDLNEIDAKDAQSYWEEYVKDHGKLKNNRKADELYAEGIRIPAISSNSFNMFSKVEDLKGSSRLYLWIDTGSAFLSSDGDAKMYKNAKIYVDDFATMAEKKHVEQLLREEEKALGKLEKDQKGLEKDKENYEKDIQDAKDKIAKNEQNIEENIEAQEAKQDEIAKQTSMIDKIKERLANVGKKKTKM